jgi:8-oxo-dGTP pyrophosphatase MutT (NUDIX family)
MAKAAGRSPAGSLVAAARTSKPPPSIDGKAKLPPPTPTELALAQLVRVAVAKQQTAEYNATRLQRQVDLLAARLQTRPSAPPAPQKPVVLRTKRGERLAAPVWPSAAVEAWYRDKLYKLVRDMSQAMMTTVRAAWRRAAAQGRVASDAAMAEAAGVEFMTPDGRVLLLHRTDGEGWAFPAGGAEPGETPEMNARREASEETGWSAGLPLHSIGVREHHGLRFTTFVCLVPEPFQPFLNSEHDRAVWMTPRAALLDGSTLHPGVRATLTIQASGAQDDLPMQADIDRWADKWVSKFEAMSDRLAAQFTKKAARATRTSMQTEFRKAGWVVEFKPSKATLKGYTDVAKENVQLIRSIPRQYLQAVQKQVRQSVLDGGDLATLTRWIQEEYGKTHRRAALIARDQNNKAKAAMEDAHRMDLGITDAVWKHSHAGKVPRPIHLHQFDGKRYKVGKGLYDRDEGAWLLPGEAVNCRCSSFTILPGFNDG